MAGDIEAAVAGSGTGGFHRGEHLRWNDDAGNFVVETESLLVAIERPDSDEHGDGWLATEFFDEGVPVLGIEDWLGHREMRAGFDFGVEAFNFVVEIIGNGIDSDADGEIRCPAKRFASPVRALIQAAKNFY